ncbi:hypothetical protein D3C81_1437270 [compost metagenome]
MRAGLELFTGQGLADQRRGHRLHRHRQDRLALGLLDVARHASDGTAGAHARHQHIDRAVGVVPDFRAGGLFMDRRVGRVLELAWLEVLGWVGVDDFVGLLDRALHALGRLGQHQLGAQRLEHLASLQAHRGRHGQHQLVTTRRGDKSQADAGVAGGRFDDGHARLELAAALGVPDHVRADPAFDRVAWVAPFDLGQDGYPARGDAVDLHQRRVTDGMGVVCVDTAHGRGP